MGGYSKNLFTMVFNASITKDISKIQNRSSLCNVLEHYFTLISLYIKNLFTVVFNASITKDISKIQISHSKKLFTVIFNASITKDISKIENRQSL
jgi:hypothetical protein